MSSSPRIATFRMPICCIVVATLAGCGHEQVRRVPATVSTSEITVHAPRVQKRRVGEQAAVIAVRQLGVPYQYGGTDTEGFDCSGLVHFAYANVGKRIPRTTAEQWRQLSPISSNDMRIGDLVFFRIDGKISHVGMYLGDKRFVHAPSTGNNVTTASLDSDYYRRAFVRAGRPD